MTKDQGATVVIGCFAVVILAIGFSLLFALPTMLLWNWLMPEIFAVKAITFWQAWGINWLAAILFKSNTITTKKE
jgi:hypothetical protein